MKDTKDMAEAEMKEDEIEEFISNESNSPEKRKELAINWLNKLCNPDHISNDFNKKKLVRIIKSGLVNDKLSDFVFSDEFRGQKQQLVIDAIKEISKDQFMEIGKFKDLLKSLPPEFIKEKKQDLVEIQKDLGKKIRKKGDEMGRKSGIMADSFQRMKNILTMGFIPEDKKTVRTKFIDRQKAIGEAIRSSRMERVMQKANVLYNKAKKAVGRQR